MGTNETAPRPAESPRAITDHTARAALFRSARPFLVFLTATGIAVLGIVALEMRWRHLETKVAARSELVGGHIVHIHGDFLDIALSDGSATSTLVANSDFYAVGQEVGVFVPRDGTRAFHLRGNERALLGEGTWGSYKVLGIAAFLLTPVTMVLGYRFLRRTWALVRYPLVPVEVVRLPDAEFRLSVRRPADDARILASRHRLPRAFRARIAGPAAPRSPLGVRSVLLVDRDARLHLLRGPFRWFAEPAPPPDATRRAKPVLAEAVRPSQVQIDRALRLLSDRKPDVTRIAIAHRPAGQETVTSCALWRPDGRRLGFVGRSGDDHWLTDEDGQQIVELEDRGRGREAVIAADLDVGSVTGSLHRTVSLTLRPVTWHLDSATCSAELVDADGGTVAFASRLVLDPKGDPTGEMTTAVLLSAGLEGLARWIALLILLAEIGPPTPPPSSGD